MTSSIYDLTVTDISGKEVPLADYRGKTLLIVNTASACGFTPQYKELEELYQTYKAQGLEILGFPCNQFGAQEKGDEAAIASFCELNFGVTFPLFAKIDVNGDKATPLYQHLKSAAPGLLGSKAVKWNFTKFLISADGSKVQRFAPKTKPNEMVEQIKNCLPTS
ncbi:glutathione peroxidase [Shewanella gelidii]|uniref:Glutathione peroxidase n=1 Tax=Shewanella gelidii TaxID=1642821 RepID=A0A917JK04_9GAMM|nr:glutathione peroxidase [Shewanella gelidii]MCL1097253.1 glutathione peroxidase [Shewanella gelidii]GGI73670.1 glutathione peroxidase [Shewanella gelidii]